MIVLRLAGDGLRSGGAPVCDDHGLVIPDTVSAYASRFSGEYVACCEACGLVFAYWDCQCEWEHECDGLDQ